MVMFVFESRERGLVYLWMSGTVEWEGLHVGGIQLTTGEYVRIDVTECNSPDPSELEIGASSKKVSHRDLQLPPRRFKSLPQVDRNQFMKDSVL